MNTILKNYYNSKINLIYESLRTVTPVKCSNAYFNKIVGNWGPDWEIDTLQKFFFDPINNYIKEKESFELGLGCCIFLEAGDLSLESFLPLLAQSELLDISRAMFMNITSSSNVPNQDVQILGNVGVALITLPTHILKSEAMGLSDKQRYKLLSQSLTIAFRSFFANGIKLFWKNQRSINPTITQYLSMAALLNIAIIKFPLDLMLILKNDVSNNKFNDFQLAAENFSVSFQLNKDLNSFHEWCEDKSNVNPNTFTLNCNYLSLFACSYYQDDKVFHGVSKENVINLIQSTNAIENLQNLKIKYLNHTIQYLQKYPFKKEYKLLIKSYLKFLVN